MRRLAPLMIVVAAAALVFMAWIVGDRSAAKRVYDAGSIENTADEGASHAFKYLQRTGRRVARLDHALRPSAAAPDGVVFRLGATTTRPFTIAEDDEEEDDKKKPGTKKPAERVGPPVFAAEEEAWVRGGGRLVLALRDDDAALRTVKAKTARKVFPLWANLDTIALPDPHALIEATVPVHAVTLYEAANRPVIVRQAIGKGDLIIIAAPELFENESLGSGHHLELLTAMAGKRPVYFDETIHGLTASDGAITLMKEWGLGPFLLLALATGLLVFWRRAMRVGLPEDDYRETRSDAVDLVASLGALYRKTMTDGEALSLYRETLVRTVAAQTGLRGDALHRHVSDITHGVTAAAETKLNAASLRRHLDALNAGFRSLEGGRARHANHR